MKNFIKNRWSDILLGLFLLLMLIPQTRQPLQVVIQRLIAFSPNTIDKDEREQLVNYTLYMENSEGNTINLADNQKSVVIINFWATWCPPCIAEMPDFQDLYKDYQNKVKFYFITQDEWKLIEKFENKRQYDLPYYRLLQPNDQLNYTQLPTTYVIGKNGEIVLEKTGVADWNSADFRQTLDDLILE